MANTEEVTLEYLKNKWITDYVPTECDYKELFDFLGQQADWNEQDLEKMGFIKNKPIVPTLVSQLTNDEGYIKLSDIPNVPVDSVNGQTGEVVLDTDDVAEGGANLYYKDTRVSANVDVAANKAKVSANGSVTTHSDVTDAGSGEIITDVEREKLNNITPFSGDYGDLSNKPDLQEVTNNGAETTKPITVDADGMAVAIKGNGVGTRAFGFENTAADSYYFEQEVSGRLPRFNSDFKLKFGAEDILKIFRGGLIEIYKEITLNGGSFFVHNVTEFRNENTRFNNGFRIGTGGSYMKVEESVTANRTATFQDKDGTIAYLSDITAPNRTMDDPTTQTSASLNSAFPFAENPVGTTVTNLNALQLFMYVRISELIWRVVTLGATI